MSVRCDDEQVSVSVNDLANRVCGLRIVSKRVGVDRTCNRVVAQGRVTNVRLSPHAVVKFAVRQTCYHETWVTHDGCSHRLASTLRQAATGLYAHGWLRNRVVVDIECHALFQPFYVI